MASSGAAAWAKYYQGKGDLASTIKIAGSVYDEKTSNATGAQLPAGTPVLVLASKEYESKPRIRVTIGGTVQTVRFKFDSITKPGNKASAASSLKPQAFNVVTSTPIQFTEYKKRLLDALQERTDLDGPLKGYLTEIVHY